MPNYRDLLAVVVDETMACQDPESPESLQRFEGEYAPLGPSIIGPAGGFPTTDRAMDALAEIADRFRGNDKNLNRISSQTAIRRLTSQAVGDVLQDIVREADAGERWWLVRKRMQERASELPRDLMHYIPAWIFVRQACDPFSIGPVRMVPRPLWPDVIRERKESEPNWLPHLRTLWAGGRLDGGSWRVGLRAGVRRALKSPRAPHSWLAAATQARAMSRPPEVVNAYRVARLVHPDQWVACVEINGFEPEESRRRGLLAVRVALDTIRLVLPRGERKLIHTAADNTEPLAIDRLNQVAGQDLARGWHMNHPGVGGPPGEASKIVAHAVRLFVAAGECIGAAVDPGGAGHGCPKLAERWFNAVHWFGRACLADADFVAVVMLIISLDVLSGGLEEYGILDLTARLTGTPKSQPVLRDGTTLAHLILKGFKLRSELAHGSVLAVHSQLDVERGRIEELAAVALAEYVLKLSAYAQAAGVDDRDEFCEHLPPAMP